jgi:hypothetical protein
MPCAFDSGKGGSFFVSKRVPHTPLLRVGLELSPILKLVILNEAGRFLLPVALLRDGRPAQ